MNDKCKCGCGKELLNSENGEYLLFHWDSSRKKAPGRKAGPTQSHVIRRTDVFLNGGKS